MGGGVKLIETMSQNMQFFFFDGVPKQETSVKAFFSLIVLCRIQYKIFMGVYCHVAFL